jgi:two-component system sensor histidine kinase MprB
VTRAAEDRQDSEEQTPRRMSLRRRVTLLAATCVAGTVALVSFGAYWTMRANLYETLDEQLIERAENAVQSPPVTNRVEQIPAAFLASTDIEIGVLSLAGRPGVAQMRNPVGHAPPWGESELRVASGLQDISLRTEPKTNSRVIALPSGPGEAMVLAQPLEPTQQILRRLALVLFGVGGAGVLVAAGAGTAVARGSLRPVENLTAATERVSATGDLRPIPVTGDDELARLTVSFNRMLAAVEDAQRRQRQLVADAGHELRTPLTSMRTNLELLLAADKPGARTLSPEDRADIARDVTGQLDEITQLIGDLSLLARGDAPPAEPERVEMVDVVERALERARRRAGSIEFDVSLQPWAVYGDSSELERAVLNLLDNAVKFSPENGTVEVRLRPLGDGTAVVEVADEGPGIADDDIPNVFERFYRSVSARGLPGSGLGLAIVKQAAQRHGGAVYAGRSARGGALMTIRLPGEPG